MIRHGGVEVDVAVKILRKDLEPSSQGVERLRDEGRLLGMLTHPAVLRVYDMVEVEGRTALITEYVAGEDLDGLMMGASPPSARAIFECLGQIAEALHAAWSYPSPATGKPLRLVHRDVKPENIRVQPDAQVKLLDFGIAKASEVAREAETSANIIMGSTHYIAPERLVDARVGPETDVFAVGCTLYWCLTGKTVFERKSMRQMHRLMSRLERYDPFIDVALGHLPRDLPKKAVELVRQTLALDPADRPSAEELADRCDHVSALMLGQGLREYCRTRIWPEALDEDGPLSGTSFTGNTVPLVPDATQTEEHERPAPVPNTFLPTADLRPPVGVRSTPPPAPRREGPPPAAHVPTPVAARAPSSAPPALVELEPAAARSPTGTGRKRPQQDAARKAAVSLASSVAGLLVGMGVLALVALLIALLT